MPQDSNEISAFFATLAVHTPAAQRMRYTDPQSRQTAAGLLAFICSAAVPSEV